MGTNAVSRAVSLKVDSSLFTDIGQNPLSIVLMPLRELSMQDGWNQHLTCGWKSVVG